MLKENIKLMMAKLLSEQIYQTAEITSKLISTSVLHHETFLPYKNFCKGVKDIVVCGAGPTLSMYKPVQDAIHIALNRAFLYEKVDFDFIFAQDFAGIKMVQEELVNYRRDKCVKFLGTQHNATEKMIPESLIIKANARKFDTDGYIPRNGINRNFVVDLESRPLCNMHNVGQSVMQLAFYMNPKRIFLVGCDMSGSHFTHQNQSDTEIERENKEMNDIWNDKKRTNKSMSNWKKIKEFGEIYYPDTQIISINPVGLKGLFTDLYQND